MRSRCSVLCYTMGSPVDLLTPPLHRPSCLMDWYINDYKIHRSIFFIVIAYMLLITSKHVIGAVPLPSMCKLHDYWNMENTKVWMLWWFGDNHEKWVMSTHKCCDCRNYYPCSSNDLGDWSSWWLMITPSTDLRILMIYLVWLRNCQ